MWLLFGYFPLRVRGSLGFRQAHNLEVAGSNPTPVTNNNNLYKIFSHLGFEAAFLCSGLLTRSLSLFGKAPCSALAVVTLRLS